MTVQKLLLATVAGALALGVAAQAHEDHVHSSNPLVDAREGGMTMMVSTLGAVSRVAEGEGPVTRAAFPASGLAAFARGMPALFGPETAGAQGSTALPAVWSDPAGFAGQIAEFQAATSTLEAATRADDREAFSAALARTKNACQSCHNSFREEPAR